MAFNDYFKVYPNRNAELRTVAKECYEFGKTIALEPSAAHSNGMDEHALERQKSYVEYATGVVNELASQPRPDQGATHPVELPINLSAPYETFVVAVGDAQVPINERTQLIAEKWAQLAVGLAKSQSASLAGSMEEFDRIRAVNNIEVIAKLLRGSEARPFLDLPETSDAGAPLQVRSGGAASR